jgi:predicted dehydrogenase
LTHPTSRRDFLKSSTVAGLTVAAGYGAVANVHAGGSDVLRVGLIGCGSPRGGRGRGAAENCVNGGPNVKLVAMGDLFRDNLDFTRNYLRKKLPADKMDVPEERCFVGFDAYKRVLDSGVDVVVLAAPPGFRPMHIQAAVAAGKHVFAEKPVATDAPGCRAVFKACEEAKAKNLSVVSGLCWRYDTAKREVFKRIHDGAVGDIVTLQCVYNTGSLWHVPRTPAMSDVEWQCRNWLYFTWLSGDFNTEQHIHSLDKMGWAMKNEYPVRAVGVGGRQVRTGPEFGHIYDHFHVVYEWADGVKCFAMCRQQDDTKKEVNDHVFGTKGRVDVMKHAITGPNKWRYRPQPGVKDDGMYQNEHNELIASIRSGKPINDGDWMTKSTLMAIMGRMAAYTGQEITWEKALNSQENLFPAKLEFGSLPTPAVAQPGVTKFA